MAAWDLMPADLRARYLDIAKAIDEDLAEEEARGEGNDQGERD